jgi:beta-glucosidase
MVLLKNDGVLPLRSGLRIAVIGPHADSTRVLRGNYSSKLSAPPISVLEGLRQTLARANVRHFPFSPSVTDGDPVPTSALLTPDGKPGLRAQYFNSVETQASQARSMMEAIEHSRHVTYSDKPVTTRIEPGVAKEPLTPPHVADVHRVVWTGFLVPPETGAYRVGLTGPGAELEFDGKIVSKPEPSIFSGIPQLATVTLQKGKRYPLRAVTAGSGLSSTDLLWKRVSTTAETDLTQAVKDIDVIVAVVGLTADMEGEESKVEIEGFSGGDKTSLDLPADQRKFLELAKSTGKPLVVVLVNGSPLDLSWARDNASAIVEAWYPGENGGLAVAQVLAGKTDPAGRLPLTFYHSVSDLPPFADYSMKGRTYRYFEGKPVYPFGFGLSFSTFAYGALKVEPAKGSAENGMRVTTEVTNTGSLEGEEVAELYLTPPSFEGAPRVALRGFRRLHLKPGEHQAVTFDLSPRDLSFVTRDGVRQVMQGSYGVSVGSGQPNTGVVTQSAQFTTDRVAAIEE